MKKIFKKVLSCFIVAALVIPIGGCNVFINKKALMLNHLKEKYNEEFEVKSYRNKNWAYGYDAMAAYPKGQKDEIFNVEGCKDRKGKYIVRDNYFQYIIRDDYEKVMSDIVKEYFTDYKIYMGKMEGMLDDSLNYGTKVSEIYDKEKLFFGNFILFVRKSEIKNLNIDEVMQKIAEERVNQKLVGEIQLAKTNDDKYPLINRENRTDSINNGDSWFDIPYTYIGVDSSLKIWK